MKKKNLKNLKLNKKLVSKLETLKGGIYREDLPSKNTQCDNILCL